MPGDGPARAPAALAFLVHIFTASGAALGLLALLAAMNQAWAAMFCYLGIALFVDGVDGAIARKLDVAYRLPNWSGETLDLVVDFVTYVFVPAVAVATGNLMPPHTAVPLAIVIVVSGALYFADRRMKTDDNYFRGFPAGWNAPVFYLFLLRPDPWISAALIVLLAVLTFVPVPFLHPFRVRRLRTLNIALLVAWAALAVVAISRDMSPDPWITAGLCAIAPYFLGAGFQRRAENNA
jgi:phosphatidylcholine synthase